MLSSHAVNVTVTPRSVTDTHVHTHTHCWQRRHAFHRTDMKSHTRTSEQLQAIRLAVAHLENQNGKSCTSTATYAQYEAEAFKTLPTLNLSVNGLELPFLVDSGATHSIIQHASMPKTKMSGRFVNSRGASGDIVKEQFTIPLSCMYVRPSLTNSEGMVVRHSFLLSPVCPINLLGRDLMCVFGLGMMSSIDGGVVICQPELICPHMPLQNTVWVHHWKVDQRMTASLLSAVTGGIPFERGGEDIDWVKPDNVHCTSHLSTCESDDFL